MPGLFAKQIDPRKGIVEHVHGAPPRMRTGIDEETDPKSAAA